MGITPTDDELFVILAQLPTEDQIRVVSYIAKGQPKIVGTDAFQKWAYLNASTAKDMRSTNPGG